jgi:uncharacterized protein YcbK (DUF882 family)
MHRLLGLLTMFAALMLLSITLTATPASARGETENPSCLPGNVKNMLSKVRAKFGSIELVSTFRPGARIRGSGHRSYHATCRAVDFNPPRGKYSAVVAFLKANWSGGVGTYSCNFHHIHIDNGPKVRFHHCQ